MIADVIVDVLDQQWGSTSEVAPGVWMLSEKKEHEKDYAIWVSACPGGSYHFFARLYVGDSGVSFSVRTVRSIIRRRFNESQGFFFEYCDPAFPDNLFEFVRRAAANALKCYELDNKRSHARRRRNERHRDSIQGTEYFQEGNREYA